MREGSGKSALAPGEFYQPASLGVPAVATVEGTLTAGGGTA
jgi:hypothetical protein